MSVELEGMRAVTGKARLFEPEDGVREALVSRGADAFVAPGEEHQARVEAIQSGLERAMQGGMEPESLRRQAS